MKATPHAFGILKRAMTATVAITTLYAVSGETWWLYGCGSHLRGLSRWTTPTRLARLPLAADRHEAAET